MEKQEEKGLADLKNPKTKRPSNDLIVHKEKTINITQSDDVFVVVVVGCCGRTRPVCQCTNVGDTTLAQPDLIQSDPSCGYYCKTITNMMRRFENLLKTAR